MIVFYLRQVGLGKTIARYSPFKKISEFKELYTTLQRNKYGDEK
jgi:hypothetical protein